MPPTTSLAGPASTATVPPTNPPEVAGAKAETFTPDNPCRSVAMLLASAVLRSPCGVTGVLGVSWGEEAEAAAVRLGAPCTTWDSWREQSEFETCANRDAAVTVYGAKPFLRFVRRGRQLEGLEMQFPRTHWADIRAAALADLPTSETLASSKNPYIVFANGSLVRVEEYGGDGSVTVTVAGPAFGETYSSHLLGQGFGGLFVIHH